MRAGRHGVPPAAALLLVAALALVAAPGGARAASAVIAAAAAPSFAAAAQAVQPGGNLTVTDYRLEGDAAASTLQLRRLEVWAPGARVWLQAAADAPPQQVAAPATRVFRGSIAGHPESAVIMAVSADGGVSGHAFRGNASWALGKAGAPSGASPAAAAAAAAAPLASVMVQPKDVQALPPFACGVAGLGPAGDAAGSGSSSSSGPAAGNPLGGSARKLLQVRPVGPLLADGCLVLRCGLSSSAHHLASGTGLAGAPQRRRASRPTPLHACTATSACPACLFRYRRLSRTPVPSRYWTKPRWPPWQ